MEKVTLRYFVFNEVLVLKLVEQTNTQGTMWAVIVATLDDNENEDSLVFEERVANKGAAETIFQNKYNCLLGLVE